MRSVVIWLFSCLVPWLCEGEAFQSFSSVADRRFEVLRCYSRGVVC